MYERKEEIITRFLQVCRRKVDFFARETQQMRNNGTLFTREVPFGEEKKVEDDVISAI